MAHHSLPIREAYLHDVDLGKPLEPEEITKLINDNRHNEGVRAILQLLRNNAMQNSVAAHDSIAAGQDSCGHLNVGGQQALTEVFFQIVGAQNAAVEIDEHGEAVG